MVSVLALHPISAICRGVTIMIVLSISSYNAASFAPSIGSIPTSGRASFLHSHRSTPAEKDGDDGKISQPAVFGRNGITEDLPTRSASRCLARWTESLAHTGKTAVTTAFTVGALLFSPPAIHFDSPSGTTLQLPTTVRLRTSIEPALAAETSDTATAATTTGTKTVLDEVWNLVDKYYVDRNLQKDWPSARDIYSSKLPKNPSDDDVMKVTASMVSSLGDKYSRILDRASYARIQKFDLIGVGLMLMPDLNDPDRKIMVGAPPVAGSAAEKVGIKYGDYVMAVNGRETKGRTAFDIIDQIGENPEAGTVRMTVLTVDGESVEGPREVTMARKFSKVNNPVTFKMSERRQDGTNVGYIRVSEFNSLLNSKLEEALKTLEAQGANAYVLDMRSNPGGAFQSAVEIAGLFVDNRVAVTVVDSNNVKQSFRTTAGKMIVDKTDPITIWLDNRSASATEVFAGAMHDQCRAVVMGSTNSFGKGLIQAVYGLQNGGGLVLTVARYITPSGTDIQGTGISPDINTNLPLLFSPSDTSKVDFVDVSSRLKGQMCAPVA